MSLISSIFNSLTGNDEEESVSYPCSNCDSGCSVYPNACEACKPYKTQLIDALYNVEHIDAFYDKYEVASVTTTATVAKECPYCGAQTTGSVCEYCGSQIGEDNGKIQVNSASEIPNPIIEARNIIYERRSVIDKYSGNDNQSSGLLSSIVSALTGDDEEENSLGTPMTESEIKAMAEKYSVSVKDYLEGLDNGTYLSKKAYEAQQSAAATSTTYSGVGTAAGVAGIGAIAGSILGNSYSHSSQPRPPMNQPQNRPPMQNQQQNRPPVQNQQRPEHNGMQQSSVRPSNQQHQGNNHSSAQQHQSGNRPGQQMGGNRPSGQQHQSNNRPSGQQGGGRPSGNGGPGGGSHGGRR